VKILILEPFLGGSHQSWAEALASKSRHEIQILGLSAHHWKWRMHGGAISLAERYLAMDFEADLILATDMLDLTTFLALTRAKTAKTKTAIYFHENQLNYPWSPQDQDVKLERKHHYAFINYASALAADRCFFNSAYHKDAFLEELPRFLKMFPSPQNLQTVEKIEEKSQLLELGMNLQAFDAFKSYPDENRGVILWNHRWEYDKNPEAFFKALFELDEHGIDFKLVVLGAKNEEYPAIFDEAKERLAGHILHWGYVDSFEEYAKWLWKSDLLPVTSIQDFFGMSVIEAVYCNVKPLLPKRLAYPGHFPQPYLQAPFFYEESESLVKRIQGILFSMSMFRKQQTQQYVQHYDWENLIEKYDDAFEF
jgi:glycosyltransferase involved in cell wall biosynthesis